MMDDNGWMPIETAPKDGTRVLVWMPYDEPECDIGFWCGDDQCWRFSGDDGPHDMPPTHWRPLPAPPETDHDDR